MKNKKTPHKVEISFSPGKGFSVTVSQPGECRTCPDSFVSLLAAARFAEKELTRAGFTTEEAAE
jgi:hypothetical protein